MHFIEPNIIGGTTCHWILEFLKCKNEIYQQTDGGIGRVQRLDEKTGSFLLYKYPSEVMQYGHYKISKMAHFSYILLLITVHLSIGHKCTWKIFLKCFRKWYGWLNNLCLSSCIEGRNIKKKKKIAESTISKSCIFMAQNNP